MRELTEQEIKEIKDKAHRDSPHIRMVIKPTKPNKTLIEKIKQRIINFNEWMKK